MDSDFKLPIAITVCFILTVLSIVIVAHKTTMQGSEARFARNLACIQAGGSYDYQEAYWICKK
jgi:hypothetical protein